MGFEDAALRAFAGLAQLQRDPPLVAESKMQHARDRVRQLTTRQRLLLPVEEVTREINTFLRGWAGYFRYGNSAPHFDAITAYAFNRLALFVGKRREHGRDYGTGSSRGPSASA